MPLAVKKIDRISFIIPKRKQGITIPYAEMMYNWHDTVSTMTSINIGSLYNDINTTLWLKG